MTERGTPRGGGVVTFLFTDLVGSTKALSRLGDDAAEELRQAHFAVLRGAIAGSDGEEVKNLGDGLMVAFGSPLDAVGAAVRIQEAIEAHNRERPGHAMAVRVGLQAGEPVREEGDYFGTPVVVAKRLCDAAKGGQILAGELVAALVGSRGGFRFRPAGGLELKGLGQPVPAVEVEWGAGAATAPSASRPAAKRARRTAPRGPNLVGRANELALLEEEYAQAIGGQFRCVLVVGEPGVGKTRLAGELLGRHCDRATVLQSRAHPMATGVAFGLWAEALDPHLQERGDDEVADLCGGFLDDLAGLFHRVAAVRGRVPEGEAPRPRLLAGLSRLVGEIALRAPVTVLLDDVHWADASSWEVLRHLARQLDDAPLLVVMTARPAELTGNEAAAQVLFELDQDGLLTRLDLATLDAPALRALAEELTGTHPPPVLVDWLADRSRGNALFAIGLLRALLEEGADLAAPVLRRLPENLSERVVARVRNIEPAQLAVLEMLAVAGRPVSLGELGALTGQPLEQLGPVLADLVSTRGVVESERGRSLIYEMNHPLVRDVIYEQMGGARRRLMHRQAGRVLREAGRVAEAALHYARSAEPGDSEAVDALVAALREAETRDAVHEALMLLGELVELLPAQDGRWLAVLDAMQGPAEWITDHRLDSLAAARVAVTALRAIDAQLDEDSDPARRGLVAFRLSHFLAWGTGELVEAELACRHARELFDAAGDDHYVRRADGELAWIRGLAGDLPEMQTRAEAVLTAAEAADDGLVSVSALAAIGFSATCRGRFAEMYAAAERAAAIEHYGSSAFRHTAWAVRVAFGLAMEGESGRARRAISEGKLSNPDYRDNVLLESEVGVGLIAGDYPAALEAARDSARAHPAATPRRIPGVLFGALAAIEMGEVEEAARRAERARAVLLGRDWQIYLPLTAYVEGLVAWSQGRVAESVPILRAAVDGLLAMDANAFVSLVLPDLVEAAHEAGSREGTASAADDMARVAARLDRPMHHGLATTAAAWAASAAGEATVAAAAARDAVTLLSTVDRPAALARAHDALGRVCTGADRAEGVAALEEAARLYAACGATWRRGRTLDVLRRQGSAGRRAMAAALGPDSLTRRERDVARLAAQGGSARDIAEQLFIGERTVESHLGNVYAKLGVESKLDLVRRAAELGLT